MSLKLFAYLISYDLVISRVAIIMRHVMRGDLSFLISLLLSSFRLALFVVTVMFYVSYVPLPPCKQNENDTFLLAEAG